MNRRTSRMPVAGLLAGTCFLLAPVLLLLGLSSCGTQTALETNWVLPDYEGRPMEKVAVIGVMREEDLSTAFESSMVSHLEKRGIEAVPGFTFLRGDKKKLSKADLSQYLDGTAADGVLLFRVVGVDRSGRYVPPTTYISPVDPAAASWWDDPYWGYYNPYPHGYWEYWYPSIQVVSAPGYWDLSETYRVQSALYRIEDDKLVWTAVSSTFDPVSETDLASSLAEVVANQLKKADLVDAQTPA